MTKNYSGEKWKVIKFDFEYTNEMRLEVSNLGRIRSFNKISNGNILKGSMINGYKIIRLKFFTKREDSKQREFDNQKAQILKLNRKLRSYKENKEPKALIKQTEEKIKALQNSLTQKIKLNEKERTIYFHSLVHRFVATYFLPKPKKEQVVVAHLDFNKLNNRASNLKWMTAVENYKHQSKSPYVIAQQRERENNSGGNTKLSVTKVMLLKKLLNENKPVRKLAKQFKVTDTQIIRIRKGENWGQVKAAK